MKTLQYALVALALSGAPAMAQDAEPTPAASASPAAAAPAAPAAPTSPFTPPEPAPETDQMRKWEGTFKTQATFVKGAMLSEGGEAKGTYTVKRGLRGHAYIGEYFATGSGGEFEGRSVRMFDPLTKKWKTWWFDSWVPGHATVSVGEVQADGAFVSESETESADKKYKMRMTERWPDDNKVEQTYEADHGDGWKTVMTIAYTRKGKWKEPKQPKAARKKSKDKDADTAAKGDEKDKESKPKKARSRKKKPVEDEPPDPREAEEKAAAESADDGGDE